MTSKENKTQKIFGGLTMLVQDLTREQIEELKNSFFYQDETQDILQAEYASPDEIPDDIIIEHYSSVWFVSDDFFCTAGKE